MNNLQSLYANRFDGEHAQKNAMWQVLCQYFRRYLPPPSEGFGHSHVTIVDIGAGYCEFINNIPADVKYACDLNPDVAKYCADNVMTVVGTVADLLAKTGAEIADVVFVSNFFEHLDSKEAVSDVLGHAKELLRTGGRLLILQPNIKYTGGKYWDFFDHKIPLTEKALMECADMHGLKTVKIIKRFLPYTTKSALPKSPWLISLYLRLLPVSGMIFGEQSFLVFEK